MKKLLIISIAVLFAVLPFFHTAFFTEASAYAEEEAANIKEELEKTVDENLSGLNLGDFELFFQELDKQFSANFGSSVREIIGGILRNDPNVDFSDLLKLTLNSLIKQLFAALPAAVSIVIIAVLYGILKGLVSGFSKESTSKIVYLVCYGAIVSILAYSVISNVATAKKAVSSIGKLLEIVFPILLTLTTAMGGAGSAAVYQPMMTILTSVIIKVIGSVVFPLFFAAMVFCIVGNMSDNIKLDKLTKTSKSAAEWLLGIMFSVFTIFITAQGITGAAYDTVAVKTTKFALSSYVPILGGYLSDGFDLVMASCLLIKNAVGLTAIIVLFLTVLIPVLKLVVTVFALRIAASIIEPVSDKKFSELLYSTSKILTLLIAIVLGVAFLGFIVIMLIIYTCNFGVV